MSRLVDRMFRNFAGRVEVKDAFATSARSKTASMPRRLPNARVHYGPAMQNENRTLRYLTAAGHSYADCKRFD